MPVAAHASHEGHEALASPSTTASTAQKSASVSGLTVGLFSLGNTAVSSAMSALGRFIFSPTFRFPAASLGSSAALDLVSGIRTPVCSR